MMASCDLHTALNETPLFRKEQKGTMWMVDFAENLEVAQEAACRVDTTQELAFREAGCKINMEINIKK